MKSDIKGFVIAATKSGSGKTTVSLGLMAALARRGFSVAPFKVGPDFIDPGHHTRIIGKQSRNLDGWMLSEEYNIFTFNRHTEGADIAIAEGVMGLFDGYDGKTEAGSTAQMAKWLGLPVLLVVDVKSMARSAAALIQGFERFDPDLTFAGVLFNYVASDRHLTYLKDALADYVEMPCLGGLIYDDTIQIPERHLGLVTSQDHQLSEERIGALADLIENSMDVERFLTHLPDPVTHKKEIRLPYHQPCVSQEPRVRIGIATDRAFCFYYPDNLEMLEQYGAELIFFSPISDSELPPCLDGIYFGGGYPEIHAKSLAENSDMRQQVRKKQQQGMPIYAECGGFMYLCQEIVNTDGTAYPMVGCFPFATRMLPRLKSLGYRDISLDRDTVIGKRGWKIRGHEFHYSERISSSREVETVYKVTPRAGGQPSAEGYQIDRCLGSYIHLHFGSCKLAAAAFVSQCREYRQERMKNRYGR